MQIVGEEHSKKLLENFSRRVEHDMTAMLKHIVEEESKYQHEEQMEEVGVEPTQEKLTGENFSEEMVEQQPSN